MSNTGSGYSALGFGDYTSMNANVTAGSSYNFSLAAVTSANGSYFPQHISIWLDYNHEGVFTGSSSGSAGTELLYQSSGSVMNGTSIISGSIIIPNTTLGGLARLRVRSQFNGSGIVTDPCGNYSYG